MGVLVGADIAALIGRQRRLSRWTRDVAVMSLVARNARSCGWSRAADGLRLRLRLRLGARGPPRMLLGLPTVSRGGDASRRWRSPALRPVGPRSMRAVTPLMARDRGCRRRPHMPMTRRSPSLAGPLCNPFTS